MIDRAAIERGKRMDAHAQAARLSSRLGGLAAIIYEKDAQSEEGRPYTTTWVRTEREDPPEGYTRIEAVYINGKHQERNAAQ